MRKIFRFLSCLVLAGGGSPIIGQVLGGFEGQQKIDRPTCMPEGTDVDTAAKKPPAATPLQIHLIS